MLVHSFLIACGDTSVPKETSELQIALVANLNPSPSLGFMPLQPNLRDSEFSEDMNLIFRRMLAFKPKKIFVDSIPGSRECVELNKSFRSFVFNQDLIHSLPSDVNHQVGFRLAYKLGHHRLYCVDANRANQEQKDQEAQLLLDANELAEINNDFRHVEKHIASFIEDDKAANAFEFINEVEQLKELRDLRLRLYQNENSQAARSWQERIGLIINNLKKETSELDDHILVLFNPMHIYDFKLEIETSSLNTEVLFLEDL